MTPQRPSTRRRATALAAALTVLTALAVRTGPGAAGAEPSAAPPMADVIVQFTAAPALTGGSVNSPAEARSTAARLAAAHRQFGQELEADGITATGRADFTELYNGVALHLPQSAVARLSGLPGVAAVHPDNTFHAAVDEDDSAVGAPAVWKTRDPAGKANRGAGQTVAVIDTGIDYTHPDLGDGFGRGHKVVAGYDYVNNDADPRDDNGHGTHVAGIIAGDTTSADGRTGVAPDATLTAYKVLDSNGNGSESTILEGLEAAVDPANPHRAGIVNLSLEGDASVDDPLTAACETAEQDGVVVVAAAGNHGPGEGSVGSPGNAPDVLTVGASTSGVQVPQLRVVSPQSRALPSQRMGLSANPPASPRQLPVTDVGNGQAGDYDGKDVTGKAVLLSLPPAAQLLATVTLAKQHGAALMIFHTPDYYDSPGSPATRPAFATSSTDGTTLGIVAMVINGSDATELQNELAGGTVRVQLSGVDSTDEIPDFSAAGPTPGDYALKPDLVAPGVEIRSTVPGGYERMSGTSMAAPHVAGAAALLMEAHPTWTAADVTAALTGSAHPLADTDPDYAGAGRLDVAAADRATVLASPRILDLGVADLSAKRVAASGSITLTNKGSRALTTTLQVSPHSGSARVAPATVHIPAGRTARVTVTVSAADPTLSQDLTGVVNARSGGQLTTVPYLLVARPLTLHATVDPTATTSRVLIHAEPGTTGAPQVTVTAPGGRTSTPAATPFQPGWWQITAGGKKTGVYQVRAAATATGGAVLTGATSFEVTGAVGAGDWQSVGPDGDGGQVAIAPTRPGRMYALTAAGKAGLFRTDDYGATWQEERSLPVGDGDDADLAVDPRNADTVYLAVNSNGGDPSYAGQLLVSHDAGATWTSTSAPNDYLLDVALDGTGKTLAVSTSDTVYVSRDHGTSFSPIAVPTDDIEEIHILGPDLYIATGDGLFVVRDITGNPRPIQQLTSGELTRDIISDGNALIALIQGKLTISHDDGKTWATIFTAPASDPFPTSVHMVGNDIYTSGTKDIWVSQDTGQSWSTIPAPVPGSQRFTVTSWKAGLVVGVQGVGLYQTADAGKTYRRIGTTAVRVDALAVTTGSSGEQRLAAGTDHDNYSTPLPTGTVDQSTRDWGRNGDEGRLYGQITAMTVSPANPATVYRTIHTAQSFWSIDRSTDGGVTWQTIERPRGSGQAYQIAVSPADPDRIYIPYVDALGYGVLVSSDGGTHWRAIDTPGQFTAVAADPRNADHLWLGGPGGLYVSADAGASLTRLSSTPVTALAVDPGNPRHLLIGGAGVASSPDGGKTISPMRDNGLRMRVTALVLAPDGTSYAATGQSVDSAGLPVNGRGVLRSRDGGRTWTNLSAGLPDLDVTAIALSADGKWLFAGTGGGGAYRLPTGG